MALAKGGEAILVQALAREAEAPDLEQAVQELLAFAGLLSEKYGALPVAKIMVRVAHTAGPYLAIRDYQAKARTKRRLRSFRRLSESNHLQAPRQGAKAPAGAEVLRHIYIPKIFA